MKVAGREIAPPFDEFWRTFEEEIGIPAECVEQGLSTVFGSQGIDVTAPKMPAWTSLPDDDLAHHVAHELTHKLLRHRGYPKTGRGRRFHEDSAEARIGADLEEMVLHPPLDELMLPFGFKGDFIQARMLSSALTGLANSPAPELGTPWFFTWAIRYCGLQLELDGDRWCGLEEAYSRSSRRVSALGEELVTIMRDVGWGTREQALEAMVSVRDTLGLKVDDRVLVLDGLTGDIL